MSIIIEFHNLNKSEIIEKNQKQTRAFYIVDKGKKMLQINTIPDSQMSVPIDQIKSFSQTILFDEFGMRKMSDLIDSIIDTSVSSKPKEAINDSFPLQQIFYGAPGTGKSHKVKEVTDTLPKSDVFRTTFHPDSDYSTFVGCYKPKMVKAPIRDSSGHEIISACEDEKKRIAYEYEPQAFLKAYVRAYETNEPVFLVIEEINRGNCAQIFGDMFQLLDRNEDGESDYAIKPETAIQEFLNEKLEDCVIADEAIKSGEEMRLPANLHIWATMNTSDQSLFPIDSAFKRRWEWKYVPIDTRKEEWRIVVNGHQYKWSRFLEIMNEKIFGKTQSEDKQLGFYFCKAKNNVITAENFVGKALFFIYNDVYKDYGFDDDFFNDNNEKISFPKYFNSTGSINEAKVEKFLNNLGMEPDLVPTTEPELEDVEEDNLEEDVLSKLLVTNNEESYISNGGRDNSRYSLNGRGDYKKGPLAQAALQFYVDSHPEKTSEEVYREWKSLNLTLPSNFIETEGEYLSRTNRSKDTNTRSKKVSWGGGKVLYISTQWTLDSITIFKNRVNAKNWGIRIEKISE